MQSNAWKLPTILAAIAAAQQNNAVCAFISFTEYDLNTFRAAGIRVEELLLSRPDTAVQAVEIAETLIRSGNVEFVALPSISNSSVMYLHRIAGNMRVMLVTL